MTARLVSKDKNHFYNEEILSDFQARQKATIKELESMPKDVPNHVGMQTINPKSNAGKYFVEFASASTIHGFNHLVAPNRHPVERFLAVLFIVGALLCLIFLSCLFWERYQNNATVIVVDNNHDQFKIPKPALFICPFQNVRKSKIPEVLKKHEIEHTPEAEQFFTFLANMGYENMSNTPLFDKVPPNKWLEVLYDLRQYIPRNYLRENDPYEAWVATERGVCLATRSVFAAYTSLEYWRINNWTRIRIPDKLPYYDRKSEFTQDVISLEFSAWFALCDPFEVITYNTPIKLIPPKIYQRKIMSITEIKTKENVRDLQVKQRKCKFSTDGGLTTWPVYSSNMCTIECRMKVIEKYCKCRPHFSRPKGGVGLCNAVQLRCIGAIIEKLFLYEPAPSFCKCIPNCDLVMYQMRDSESSSLYDTPTSLAVVALTIELPQVIYYRALLYGFTDFLTGVGGAAGLFLGASVLSFVEIFYYVTLRVCFYVKQVKQKNNK